MGMDFRDSGLKRISTGGTMVSDDLKQRVLETWGIPLSEGYGLTEALTVVAGECGQSDRMHFTDMSGYAEVLDPETEEPVPAGQPGVMTVTTFYPDRELMPLLRYWTDDLVIMSPDRICACGLPTTQIVDIVGRVDHMVKVGPQPFYPQAIGDSLLAFRELVLPPRFTLRTEQRGDTQHAILDVEVESSVSPQDEEALCQRIKEGVVVSRYWQVEAGLIKLEVNLLPAGSMEHPFPYKHRHLVLAQRESGS
jgi:phenylacetate-CoA ligase